MGCLKVKCKLVFSSKKLFKPINSCTLDRTFLCLDFHDALYNTLIPLQYSNYPTMFHGAVVRSSCRSNIINSMDFSLYIKEIQTSSNHPGRNEVSSMQAPFFLENLFDCHSNQYLRHGMWERSMNVQMYCINIEG